MRSSHRTAGWRRACATWAVAGVIAGGLALAGLGVRAAPATPAVEAAASQPAAKPSSAVRPAVRAASAPGAAALRAAAPAPPWLAGGLPVAHGLFDEVLVFRPAGEATQFVMLLLGDAPGAAERQAVQHAVAAGALVAAIPLPAFLRRLEGQGGNCLYAAGAFENLAHHVQAYVRLPTYVEPMLVGLGEPQAALAYAIAAQAPAGSFASALSAGFCPAVAAGALPLCATQALRWREGAAAGAGGHTVELLPPGAGPADGAASSARPAPAGTPAAAAPPAPGFTWAAVQTGREAACAPAAAQAFAARVPRASWVPLPGADAAASAPGVAPALPPGFATAYARLAAERVALGPPPAQLADLPIVEVPVAATPAPAGPNARRFAVLLSGDGGWAGIDKAVAAALAKQGVPVAGFDTLRYFWSARTPEGLAADLDRLIRYYAARWQRSEVLLIGYSQGADVLPFAINRLPARTRAGVRLAALLGLGQKASFEFHLSNWIGASGDRPIAPEAQKLSAAGTLCIYGSDERDSLCPQLAPKHVRALALPGGHHFGGDYDALAARILDAVPR